VHNTRISGFVWDVVFLLNGQRIHIGPQQQRWPGPVSSQQAHHSGLIHTAYFQSAFFQVSGDLFGSAVFLEPQFRVPVKIPPEFNDFIGKFSLIFSRFTVDNLVKSQKSNLFYE